MIESANKIKAYHFLREDMTSCYGNEPAWKIGEERTYESYPKLGKCGYHSSPTWHDALMNLLGNMACIVEISEPIDSDNTVCVSKTRKLIDSRNADRALRIFACDCVEHALKIAKIEDERSWNAINVSRLYADSKTTKKELADARYNAWSIGNAYNGVARLAGDAARTTAIDAVNATTNAVWKAADYEHSCDYTTANAAMRIWLDEIKWQKTHINELMNELFK